MNKNFVEKKATEKKVVKQRNVEECRIDRVEKKIILTRRFAKEAESFGSDACEKLMDAQAKFPTYSIELRTAKKREDIKGLTIPFMENHIAVRFGEDSTEYKSFLSQRELANAYKNPYIFVRNWFIRNFPDWKDHSASSKDDQKNSTAASQNASDVETTDNDVVA